MSPDDPYMVRMCPLCDQNIWVFGDRLAQHSTGICVGEDQWPIECLASHMTLAEAHRLARVLTKAAHP